MEFEQKETDDSSADVSETVKADEVCDVDDITIGLGFNDKGLVNSNASQADDCKPVSYVSQNCFDKIVHVAKDFIPIKFMKEVAERLKNKKVEENTKAANFKRPFKACFKCGQEGHLIKHCKQVDETSSSSSKRHGSDGKGNKNYFSRSKSTRNNFLNDQNKNYSSRSP
ncbi:hypothetical protein L1987_46433 [Smallanthus sonchifolius]|uniref:Uncharacterized protein n=1 Tax=Smallanthus sonchifolius TaxID=185202 RepID=A0ACB9G0A1_9ASTR|nr:hypothetical protein L1987_46433 [Smallanthus sonchifolius]